MAFYLRFEGVNHAHTIYDTRDLSTIRGGGLQLLNAAEHTVIPFLKASGETVEPVIAGASLGLLRIESSRGMKEVRGSVERKLHEDYPGMTFVVDILEATEDFAERRSLLAARNRWRRMRSPTVIYPAVEGVAEKTRVCEIDLVRPAAQRGVSDFVHERRKHGREEKRRVYARELDRIGAVAPDLPLAAQFEDIGGDSRDWGNLRDKLAVIHIDGNGFGAIIQKAASSQERQKEFGETIARNHAMFLSWLLEQHSDAGWFNQAVQVHRLETLVWGGDEMTLVVPAWKGWETLEGFFGLCKDWGHFHGEALTYKAALVFCHSKAPIHSITALTYELAHAVKEAIGDERKNAFTYKVLESFDHIGQEMSTDFLRERYPFSDDGRKLVLDGSSMHEWTRGMREIRESVPRRKLHEIVQALMANKLVEAQVTAEATMKKLRGNPEAKTAVQTIDYLSGALGEAAWYHIAELWDYVSPERIGGRQ